MTYISPYNDRHVIAGAGTVGLEIVAGLPYIERVLVPVSGGGLIAGVATAVKSLRPWAKVIGVCAESAPAMYNFFYNTTKPQVWETLAEALSGEVEAGSITLDICQQYVDEIVLVSEDQIAAAMRWMIGTQGWLVEGGGAVCVASLLHGVVPVNDAVTAAVISGGNVDLETVRQIIGAQ
jgi:threonine dehydratase